MQSDTYKQLTQPFPSEVLREVSKGGARLTYVPVAEVISRMNDILGPSGWSQEVIRVERDATDHDFVVAHVRVTADIDGIKVSRDGFGGGQIKRKKNGEIVDLGDEYKGAVSDAFKKACQQFGVGLYLARSEDALAYDDDPEPQLDPETEKLWKNLLGHSRQLDDSGKAALNDFWNTYAKGRPKPKNPMEADKDDLKALIAEAIRLSVGGEYE